MLNKKKFLSKLFIAAAISNLIILLAAFIFLKQAFLTSGTITDDNSQISESSMEQSPDPLITKSSNRKETFSEPIISEKDPVLGNKNASTTIVIFSDFDCEFCKKTETALLKLQNEIPKKLRLVWKDFPASIEPSSKSFKSAVAARCAYEKGLFWQFHDRLREIDSKDANIADLLSIAQLLGIDQNEFENCLEKESSKNAIYDNIVEANALEITGIPYMYINGRGFMGGMDYEELKTTVTQLSK
jgi:predicted DsbA family dithiol-disulfide isomerase